MGKLINPIDLADYKDLEQILKAIFRLIPDMQPPVPVEELAFDLGIEEIRDLNAEGFVGALIANPEKSRGVILVKRNLHEHRRRFTIGHELGHYLCPTHIPPKGTGFQCTPDDMHRSYAKKDDIAGLMEVQANRFSAHLLMPEKLAKPRIPMKDDPTLQHVLTLSKVFNTSKEMTVNQYVAFQDTPCAVIVSEGGKVRYPVKHDDFPFLPKLKDEPLPHKCMSAKSDLLPGYLSEPTEIDPTVWLEDDQARKVEYMSEQVLVQDGGHRMTLLVASVKDEDEEEEDEDLRSSWTPRFR